MDKKINHSEWLKERRKGIGGSDASALFGMNPFKTNIDLYNDKVFGIDNIKVDPKIVQYGIDSEPFLREMFKLDYPEYEVSYKDFDCYTHSEYPFIKGTIDGMLIDQKGRCGVLEIKTALIQNSMQWVKWREGVPDNYFIQVLHYLLVTGFEFAILKAQLKTDKDGDIKLNTRHYSIERKAVEKDIELLKQKEIDFWNNHVIPVIEPSLILPKI
jgi:putative phage-type endonuclease